MLYYPAKIEPMKEGGVTITFRDFPEVMAKTKGDTREDVIHTASNALKSAIYPYMETRRLVPRSSTSFVGEACIGLPPSMEAKILLANGLVESGMSNKKLARLMGVRTKDVSRLMARGRIPNIDMIDSAFSSLDLGLTLQVG